MFIFSKINQRDLILQLDNRNLTAEAYQINLRQNEKLSKFTKELDDSSEIDNVQVHFQSKKDKNITYFYGKGNFPVPPMVSGEFFSKNDFDSIVNVALPTIQHEFHLPISVHNRDAFEDTYDVIIASLIPCF